MPFSVWWGVKFTPGGHSSFFGYVSLHNYRMHIFLISKTSQINRFVNTAVHIVMYTYYMLAAMGPQMQKYLWWKKYLTVFQMIQFIAVMLHAFQLLIWNPCNYPIAFVWWIGMHACMFFFLFKNFFDQAYRKVSFLELFGWTWKLKLVFYFRRRRAKRSESPTNLRNAITTTKTTTSKHHCTSRWARSRTVTS